MCTNLLILFFLQTGTGRGDPKQSKSFKAPFLAIFFIVDGRLVVDHFFIIFVYVIICLFPYIPAEVGLLKWA